MGPCGGAKDSAGHETARSPPEVDERDGSTRPESYSFR